jgi:cytidylate kinase
MLITGAFEKARRYIASHSHDAEKQDRYKPEKPGPCITISRQTGCGAAEISKELIKILHSNDVEKDAEWAVFDKNLIEKVLQDHNLPLSLAKIMDEGKYSSVTTIANDLFGVYPDRWSLVHKTTVTILQIAQIGRVVIIGRGANVITAQLKNTFHIRLVALLEDRISRIQQTLSLDKYEAEKFIKNDDRARKKFLKNYFHKNIDDPLLYHAVINTNLLSTEETAQMIANCIMKKFQDVFVTKSAVVS